MGITYQSPLQLPQTLHKLWVVAWNLPHVIVLESQHSLQHETHLRVWTSPRNNTSLINVIDAKLYRKAVLYAVHCNLTVGMSH